MNNTTNVGHFFDAEAAEWSERYADDPRFARRFEKIGALLTRVASQPGRALDIGCGSGVFTRLLAERGWNVTAIDLSEAMIEQARNHELRIANYERPNEQSIQFQHLSFEIFESDAASFDLILSLSMLEYIEDDEAAIDKCSRLLRPDGVLVISVPNRAGLLRKVEAMVFGIRTVTKGKVFGNRGAYLDHQKRQYSPMELDILMRQMGMKKKRGIFLNAGVAGPRWLLPFLERRWWAAMYCGAYQKKANDHLST